MPEEMSDDRATGGRAALRTLMQSVLSDVTIRGPSYFDISVPAFETSSETTYSAITIR